MTKYLKTFFTLLVCLFIATMTIHSLGIEPEIFGYALSPVDGVAMAMSIPVGEFYMDSAIGLGKIPSHHPNTFIETKAAEGEILFGRALQFGTNREQVKTVAGNVGAFAGIALHSVTAGKLSEDKYLDADVVGVFGSGLVTVFAEEAVNAGDNVRVRHTNGTGPNTGKLAGSFCKTADAGKTYVLVGARYEKSIASAGEAIVFTSGGRVFTSD